MSCSRYKQLLSRYVDDEVTPRQRRELLAHVETCPDCAAWLARVRQTNVLLKGVADTGPSDRVRDAVLGSVRPTSASRPAPPSLRLGWAGNLRLTAAGFFLRFELSSRHIALAAVASFLGVVGLAYWLNLIPPLWGYTKLGFEFPNDSNTATVNATPLPAISLGVNGVGGPVAAPNLVRVQPADKTNQVGLNQNIVVRFDQPMDRASVESALQIDPPAGGSFNWDADNEVRFSPAAPGLLRGVTYSVTLSSSARSLAGTALDKPLSWSFHTRDPHLVTPAQSPGAGVPLTQTFSLAFDAPMDKADTASKVTLVSAASGKSIPVSLAWDPLGRGLTVTPLSPMPEGAVLLRVDSTARTQVGDTLGEPAQFTYTVALPAPRLRLLAGRLSIAQAGNPIPVRYESVSSDNAPGRQDVRLDVYALPAERLSLLGAQGHAWPEPLPSLVLSGLARLQTTLQQNGTGDAQLRALPAGTYLLVASATSDAGLLGDWQLLVVVDRGLTRAGGNLYWATGADGKPWTGSEVSLYSPDGALLEKGLVNSIGVWAPTQKAKGATLAIARDTGGHLAALALEQSAEANGAASTGDLLATMESDLGVYHPGQQVNFRVVLHSIANPEQDVSLLLLTPRGSVVSTLTLKPDSVGGVSGTFTLAPDISSGRYTVRVRSGDKQRDFPLTVQAPPNNALSVSIVPGEQVADNATAITRTVSVLGLNGAPAASATLTATLRVLGDPWVSDPVTATTDQGGQATVVMPMPAWAATFNDFGLYLNVDAGLGATSGSDAYYLDIASARAATAGVRQLASPSLDLAAVARPMPDGAIRLRLVEMGLTKAPGSLLVVGTTQSGEQEVWSIDVASVGDATLPLPQRFAGGHVELYRAGFAGSRILDLMPAQDTSALLRASAPLTAAAGSDLPVALSFVNVDEARQLTGTASIWLRRVSGGGAGDQPAPWDTGVALAASSAVTATLPAPIAPGLWYIMAEAATADGSYATSWSAVNILPGPYVQLPPATSSQVGQTQPISVVVHNPADQAFASSLKATGDDSISVVGSTSQDVQLQAGGWKRVDWQFISQRRGSSALDFSFGSSQAAQSAWVLPVQAADNPRADTTYASGVLVGERSVGVQVPSGMSGDQVRLEIRASTSLLPALANIAESLSQEPSRSGNQIPTLAARLSAPASVDSAYRRFNLDSTTQPQLLGAERSLILQQLYSAQNADGGWGPDLSGGGSSPIDATASVLLAMRRQNLAWATGGGEPQPQVDNNVVNDGLAFLTEAVSGPVGSAPTSSVLDERAYGLYVLSLYGVLQPDWARRYIQYAASSGQPDSSLSPEGQAWLALALWQTGNTADAFAIIDRLIAAAPQLGKNASAPLLDVLVAAGLATRQHGNGSQRAAIYESAAGDCVQTLMEARQGVGWASPSDTADALWALSRYAAEEGTRPQLQTPVLMLDDHVVQGANRAGNPGTISVMLQGDSLHAGTNWLKLQAPSAGQPLYYSLTLKATR